MFKLYFAKILNGISLNTIAFCLKLIIFIISIIYFSLLISEIFTAYDTVDDISNNNDSDSKPKKKSRREWGMQLITIAIFTYIAVPLTLLITFPKTCKACANYDIIGSGLAIALFSTIIFCDIAIHVLIYDLIVEEACDANNASKDDNTYNTL